MRPRLYHRLHKLEAETAQRKQRQAGDWKAARERVLAKIRLFLQLREVEQTGRESLMEAWARALGITCRELRAHLGAGIDPIHKWFTENGVFEEIERRKAAGTWPTGSKENRVADVRV